MSFGFMNVIHTIETAIGEAAQANVIMVAAAANWGGQAPTAWPARDGNVIDIYATDYNCGRIDLTPNRGGSSKGFATIGKAVSSRWPPRRGQNPKVRRSGTSIATAIAAGLAAMSLAYMKELLDRMGDQLSDSDIEGFKKIHTVRGMEVVFSHMVIQERDGYAFLSPWDCFGRGSGAFRRPEIVIPYTFLRDMHRAERTR